MESGWRRLLAFGEVGTDLSGVIYDVVGDESPESNSEVEVTAWSSRFERDEDLFFLENRPPKNGIEWRAKGAKGVDL